MKCSKKLFALLLAAVLCMGMLAGCGTDAASSAAAPASAPAPEKTEQAAAPTETTAAPAEVSAETPAAPADVERTVGVSVATATNNPHIVNVVNSLTDALEAQGWTVDLQDADGDASKQSTQFDLW